MREIIILNKQILIASLSGDGNYVSEVNGLQFGVK